MKLFFAGVLPLVIIFLLFGKEIFHNLAGFLPLVIISLVFWKGILHHRSVVRIISMLFAMYITVTSIVSFGLGLSLCVDSCLGGEDRLASWMFVILYGIVLVLLPIAPFIIGKKRKIG